MNTDTHKQQLEEEKKQLTEQLASIGSVDPKTGDWEASLEEADPSIADPNNEADRFEDFEERSDLLKTFELRLGEIDSALERIASETYGKCSVCGKDIEEARLSANPAAGTCMAHLES